MLNSEWAVILFFWERVWNTTFSSVGLLLAFCLMVFIEYAVYISMMELIMALW